MSGLLRRIKRSRAADAGETPAEGQATAPDGAPTTAARPAGEPVSAPAIEVDPDRPAGLDPAETWAEPATGRRGRLRRRLRYLRRAREVMLRDLGGLVYEVHRTAGGDVGAHGTVVAAKVQRLASLDAESGAIETALAAPRAETVVFQPGVGGICDFCGELYGSAARFCSHCGSPTGSAVRATPAPIAAPPRPLPSLPKPPARAEAAPADAAADEPATEPTEVIAGEPPATEAHDVVADEPATSEQPAATEEPATSEQAAATDEPAPDDAPADAEPAADDDSSRNPFSGLGNGRAEGDPPPGLSSGDPLARESRS
jgi:hypothetical protein